MRNSRKIVVFDFHIDHTGTLSGIPETSGNGFGKGQEYFSGSGGLSDVGRQSGGIPDTFGDMASRVDGRIFESVGVFPDGLTVGL